MNELLGTFITWATDESRRHTSFCACAPDECIVGKTDAKAIGRIHHVWREGRKESFEFHQKNLQWHVLKSGCSRRSFSDVDIIFLHANYSHVTHEEGFDSQIAQFSHGHEIRFFEEKWHCSCPCFVQFGMRKHLISFQIVVLKQEVPAACNIVRLRSRAKRGHPKKLPSPLNFTYFCEANAKEDFSDEELDDEGAVCKSEGISV